MIRGLITLILATASMAACRSSATGPLVCEPVLVSAIVLNVRDSGSGAPAASNATLTARITSVHGVFSDTGQIRPDGQTITVGAMPGMYDLLLQKPGYADWTMSNVTVDPADPQGCRPKTVLLHVSLQPAK